MLGHFLQILAEDGLPWQLGIEQTIEVHLDFTGNGTGLDIGHLRMHLGSNDNVFDGVLVGCIVHLGFTFFTIAGLTDVRHSV